MRILCTGSAGTLGRSLVPELRRRGHDVWGMDLAHSVDEQHIRANIAQHRQCWKAFEAAVPSVVISLAGEFGRLNGEQYYEDMLSTNLIGNRNVIEECIARRIPLLFASSSEAYGDLGDRVPILPESILDTCVPRFHNEYALSKWCGEQQLNIARRSRGLKAVALRFFNVYGPGEEFTPYRSVICQFIYKLLVKKPITVYDGMRDFLYVDDWTCTVANAIERHDSLPHTAYNIGGMKPYSIAEMAHMVVKEVGADLALATFQEAEPNNVFGKRPDVTRAVRDLDHRCEVELEEGIRRTVAWMRKEYGL